MAASMADDAAQPRPAGQAHQRSVDRLLHASLLLQQSVNTARVGLTRSTAGPDVDASAALLARRQQQQWRRRAADQLQGDEETPDQLLSLGSQRIEQHLLEERVREAAALHEFFAAADRRQAQQAPPAQLLHRDLKTTELLKADERLAALRAQVQSAERDCALLVDELAQLNAQLDRRPASGSDQSDNTWHLRVVQSLVLESELNWTIDPTLTQRMLS